MEITLTRSIQRWRIYHGMFLHSVTVTTQDLCLTKVSQGSVVVQLAEMQANVQISCFRETLRPGARTPANPLAGPVRALNCWQASPTASAV